MRFFCLASNITTLLFFFPRWVGGPNFDMWFVGRSVHMPSIAVVPLLTDSVLHLILRTCNGQSRQCLKQPTIDLRRSAFTCRGGALVRKLVVVHVLESCPSSADSLDRVGAHSFQRPWNAEHIKS